MGCGCGGSTHPRQAPRHATQTKAETRTPRPGGPGQPGNYYWTGPKKKEAAASPSPPSDSPAE